jgi:hypothetical protein
MSRKALLWLVPLFVTVHNLEEAIFMPAFIEKRNSSIPDSLREIIPAVTYRQFLAALMIITIIPYLLAFWAQKRETGIYLLLGFQVVMLLNVFAHVMTAIMLRGYAPGLVTALAINLPFSFYLLRRARREGWVSGKAMALMFPVGLLIHGPLLAGLMIIAGQVVGE